MGEILPFWWGMEEDADIDRTGICSPDRAGMVQGWTLVCHFSVEAPSGNAYRFTRPCQSRDLQQVRWYQDLQDDLKMTLSPARGQSWIDSSDWKQEQYGEYIIRLESVDYTLCSAYTTERWTSAVWEEHTYANRVCQFNFAVTTPYMIQKWTTMSSLVDDKTTLQKFYYIDGKKVLDNVEMQFIENVSTTTSFDEIKKLVYGYEYKAVQNLPASHVLSFVHPSLKKVPNEEIYFIDQDITLEQKGSNKFNNGKPVTIIVKWDHKVRLRWSLWGNLFLVVPDGEVVFQNTDCDRTDVIEAVILAKRMKTAYAFAWVPNSSPSLSEWCTDGKLLVKWVLISSETANMKELRLQRRSTLNDWFKGTPSEKKEYVYNDAALRIESRPNVRSEQPPLAKTSNLIFTTQSLADNVLPPLWWAVWVALLPPIYDWTIDEGIQWCAVQ